MKREDFIEEYINWLRLRMEVVLPAEATSYRMMEIVRRQHHAGVKELLSSIEDTRFCSFEN
jgi:hypothetical protein